MAKKIGIISDTHGLLRPEVLEILRTCDCILHGGDINKPEILDQIRPLASVYVVRGNNDKDWAEGLSRTLRFTPTPFITTLDVLSFCRQLNGAWKCNSLKSVFFIFYIFRRAHPCPCMKNTTEIKLIFISHLCCYILDKYLILAS